MNGTKVLNKFFSYISVVAKSLVCVCLFIAKPSDNSWFITLGVITEEAKLNDLLGRIILTGLEMEDLEKVCK